MKDVITIACGQFQPVFGDTTANLLKVKDFVEQAAANLIIFPELCASGYEFKGHRELQALALAPDSSEIRCLKEIARDFRTHIVLGLPERNSGKVYNSSILIEPSGKTTIYRKIHLFDREKRLFEPGNAEPSVVRTEIGRLGMMICFDWIFPEVVRILALKGAQIICHPANLVLQFCQRAMFARSVENGVFTATCNRVGAESRAGRTLNFTGASQILSNRGATLAQASDEKEEVIKAEIRPAEADNKMITTLNDVIGDRRIDYYKSLIV
ncbi:MAG: hypothetical protein FJY65_08360 [Calditrichaeota bacterium]|nr:hypothetical protein [Calditrichota bacterium]